MMIERKFIQESIKRLKTKEYVKKALDKAGIVDVDIQRTTLNTRIGIIAERPGLVIGRRGESIKDLSDAIEKNLGIENPQVEVADVQRPNLEPIVIARVIRRMIERGTKPKKVIKTMAAKVMKSGAQGVEIIVDGTQKRGDRSRKESIILGYLKKAGDSVKLIKVAKEQVVMKQGVMGITVKIVPPEVIFPDKVVLKKPGIAVIVEETVTTPEESKAAEETKPESGITELSEKVQPSAAEKETTKKALTEVAEKTAEKVEFKCDTCGKAFKTERGLKTHQKTHA